MTSSQTTAAPLLQNEHEMEMEMDPVALMRGDGPEERWEAISDLDAFFSRVYEYFHERGLRCILASRIISLLSLAFTIALTVFLFELLNLEGLVNDCRDEESCSNHTRVPVVRPTMRGSPFVWLYVLPIFSCYWLWTLRHFVKDLRPLLEMRDFYRDRLQIDDDELHNIAWDAVVQRIVELNDRTRLCIVKEQLTPHDIANRILRKENFMVAFVNRDLLPLQWPPPLSRFDFLTKTLEWNLYLCILDAMFDGDFKVRRSFTQDVHGVRRLQFNFMVVGALNALAFPFIAVVMLVHFFIEHFEELYRRPTASAFSRDYSRHARWMMREFNELPHAFDARIHASRDDANRYTEEFPAPLVTLLAGFVTFIVSSLVGVLLALSLINENILLFYRLPEADGDGWGFNLLWWLAMASTLLAVSRSFSTHSPRTTQPDALLRGVAQHTHYMPDHWRRRGHTRDVYLEFARLYQYKLIILLQEFLGCVTTPILLIFVMPFRAAEILEFVRTFTVHVEGVGHVCSFALFDFARHGDVRYGAPVDAPKSQRSRDGKMEQAYLNFKSQHPTWRANDDAGDAGDALLHNISTGDRLAASRHAAAAHAHAAASAAAAEEGAPPPDEHGGGGGGGGSATSAGALSTLGPLGLGGAPGAALGATLGGMGSAAIGAGSLSASQLLLLARSSQLLSTHPGADSLAALSHGLAGSGGSAGGAPPAATARSTYAREAPLSPGRASAASAAAMEATTANISESVNAALYLRMDSYFTSNSHEEGGPSHVA